DPGCDLCDIGWNVRRLTICYDQLGGTGAVSVGYGPPVLRDRVVGRVGEPFMGRDAVIEAGRIRRQNVALLVGQELLDRVCLLDVCDVPVSDPLPGRIGVTAKHQLTPRGMDLQELR